MELDPRRETDVTASDVPAICGECPFQTRRSVLYKKSLRLRSVDTEFTLHGRTYEPIALRKFCEKTGAHVLEYPCGYKRNRVYTWLGGTKDAKVRMPNGDVVVVEIKCPPKRPIKDEVPIHYIGQVQTYLFLEEDAIYALFVQYKPAGPRSVEKLQITKVERDDNYMARRLPSLKKFWNELQMWTAYVDRVVTVMQRAWRTYRSKKATDTAAKNYMAMRLKCAHTVGKMAGFCRTRDAQANMVVPKPLDGDACYVVSEDVVAKFRRGARMPPEAKRARHASNEIMVVCDDD
jgi:predicted phage-related endonuclease